MLGVSPGRREGPPAPQWCARSRARICSSTTSGALAHPGARRDAWKVARRRLLIGTCQRVRHRDDRVARLAAGARSGRAARHPARGPTAITPTASRARRPRGRSSSVTWHGSPGERAAPLGRRVPAPGERAPATCGCASPATWRARPRVQGPRSKPRSPTGARRRGGRRRGGRPRGQGRVPALAARAVGPDHVSRAQGAVRARGAGRGVPVVQPRHGAFPELIDATGGGVLVEPEDTGAIATALRGLMDDPPRRDALGRRGRDVVRRDYTDDRTAAALLNLYTTSRQSRSVAERGPCTSSGRDVGIEFVDTDQGGIVHFSRFFVFMETAEHQFLESLGHERRPGDRRGATWAGRASRPAASSCARCGSATRSRSASASCGAGARSMHLRRSSSGHDGRAVARGEMTSVCCAWRPGGLRAIASGQLATIEETAAEEKRGRAPWTLRSDEWSRGVRLASTTCARAFDVGAGARWRCCAASRSTCSSAARRWPSPGRRARARARCCT